MGIGVHAGVVPGGARGDAPARLARGAAVPAAKRAGEHARLGEAEDLGDLGQAQGRLAQVLQRQVGAHLVAQLLEGGAVLGELALQGSRRGRDRARDLADGAGRERHHRPDRAFDPRQRRLAACATAGRRAPRSSSAASARRRRPAAGPAPRPGCAPRCGPGRTTAPARRSGDAGSGRAAPGGRTAPRPAPSPARRGGGSRCRTSPCRARSPVGRRSATPWPGDR